MNMNYIFIFETNLNDYSFPTNRKKIKNEIEYN